MAITTKSVEAVIEDVEGSSDPGEFVVVLSTDATDRDGDRLFADEWEQPLPSRIQFNGDHNHKLEATVGSGVPALENGRLVVRGAYASTAYAQTVRTLHKEGHAPYASVAYREKRNQKSAKPTRELINGSFVVVPSNPQSVLLSSKSSDTLTEDDPIVQWLKTMREMSEIVTKITGEEKVDLPTGMPADGVAKHYLPEGFTADVEMDGEKSSQTLTIKDASGKVLLAHKFPAPEAPPAPAAANSAAEDEAKTFATLRAKAFGFESRHQFD